MLGIRRRFKNLAGLAELNPIITKTVHSVRRWERYLRGVYNSEAGLSVVAVVHDVHLTDRTRAYRRGL